MTWPSKKPTQCPQDTPLTLHLTLIKKQHVNFSFSFFIPERQQHQPFFSSADLVVALDGVSEEWFGDEGAYDT